MTKYYNTHYYHPDLPQGSRRVYITFTKNAHTHLHRLNATNGSLKDVYVIVYPIEDLIAHPLPEWETYPRSLKTYQELASILIKYLNFSLF